MFTSEKIRDKRTDDREETVNNGDKANRNDHADKRVVNNVSTDSLPPDGGQENPASPPT